METYYRLLPLFDILLIVSLILLAMGLFGKKRESKLVSAGEFLFGLFWLTQAPLNYLESTIDFALFSLGAFAFFTLLALRQWTGNVTDRVFRFPAMAALVTSLLYFPFVKVPALSLLIIYLVAFQTVWWINVFSPGFSVGPAQWEGSQWWYATATVPPQEVSVSILSYGEPSGIGIIVACTGIEVIVLFFGIVMASWAPQKRRAMFLAISIPAIHILNLFRNGMILHVVVKKGWDFEFAHTYVAFTLSLVAIAILAVFGFNYLPRLHREILDTAYFVVTGKKNQL